MNRLFDCFLYNHEFELLKIRIELLKSLVDRFVVVWANESFTGVRKTYDYQREKRFLKDLGSHVSVVALDTLEGASPWDKEAFSRNCLSKGLQDAKQADLVMVADVDEIPRPSVLRRLKNEGVSNQIAVLGLDYFNFKFNYQLVHGLHAVWAGPVVSNFSTFSTPQEMRNRRWTALENEDLLIRDAGWHFSYLTSNDDVSSKLGSFSHQEAEIQTRRDAIGGLIATRQGFHDHLHAGSVWRVIAMKELGCQRLQDLVSEYSELIYQGSIDDAAHTERMVKNAVHRIYNMERSKVLRWCTLSELLSELYRRLRRRGNGVLSRLRRVIGLNQV